MMGTLHGENASNAIGCSTNYVKTSREEDLSEDCSGRRDLLGSVFDYDELAYYKKAGGPILAHSNLSRDSPPRRLANKFLSNIDLPLALLRCLFQSNHSRL